MSAVNVITLPIWLTHLSLLKTAKDSQNNIFGRRLLYYFTTALLVSTELNKLQSERVTHIFTLGTRRAFS